MCRLTCLQVGPHGVAQLLNTIILHDAFKACDVLSSVSRYDLTNIQNLLACIGELRDSCRTAATAVMRQLLPDGLLQLLRARVCLMIDCHGYRRDDWVCGDSCCIPRAIIDCVVVS